MELVERITKLGFDPNQTIYRLVNLDAICMLEDSFEPEEFEAMSDAKLTHLMLSVAKGFGQIEYYEYGQAQLGLYTEPADYLSLPKPLTEELSESEKDFIMSVIEKELFFSNGSGERGHLIEAVAAAVKQEQDKLVAEEIGSDDYAADISLAESTLHKLQAREEVGN